MVDRIEFKELETEELPVTSSVLLGAAHHLGNNIKFKLFYSKYIYIINPMSKYQISQTIILSICE